MWWVETRTEQCALRARISLRINSLVQLSQPAGIKVVGWHGSD